MSRSFSRAFVMTSSGFNGASGLRRTGIRNMSRQGIPEKVGMLISGHRTDSVYRRYNIVDMEVLKSATAKIEKHEREIVQAENNHSRR